MGCSAKIRKTDDGEIGLARPWAASSAASSGAVQRDSGTPVAAGSWQASVTTAARSSALIRLGRPDPGQVLEPVQPAGGEPAPPLADRVHADVQVRGDARAGPAAGGSQHDLRPQPVPCAVLAPRARFFKVLRSPALSSTGTARYRGMPPPGVITWM